MLNIGAFQESHTKNLNVSVRQKLGLQSLWSSCSGVTGFLAVPWKLPETVNWQHRLVGCFI